MALDVRGMAPLLSVFDMPTALLFYRDILGFELVMRSGRDDDCGFALLRLNGVEVMLNTAYDAGERPEKPDASLRAGHGDICLYFGLENLDAAYEYLQSQNCKPRPPKVANYGMRQLYVTDPDGYGLCFQWPTSEEMKQQWRQWYGAGLVKE